MMAPVAANGSRKGARMNRSVADIRPGLLAAGALSVTLAMRYSRIEDRIDEVGNEVHEHEHDRDEEECALRHRIVARCDSSDEQPAETWPTEHGLDHDVVADRDTQAECERGRYRQQGIARRVPHDDRPFRQALHLRHGD